MLPGEPLIDGATALRPWRDSDLQSLVVACQDPEISRWTRVPFPYGESDARAYLLQRYDTLHAGTAAPFAIVSAVDRDELLGSISLMRFAWQHARAEVGYWLAKDARGQGHVTRAVRLICAWGFRTWASSGSTCWPRPATPPPSASPSAADSPAKLSCGPTCRARTGARTWWRSGCW